MFFAGLSLRGACRSRDDGREKVSGGRDDR